MSLDMKKEKKNIYHSLYTPKNENQELYLKHLNNQDVSIVVSIGPAGTGKTMFACIKAIEDYKNGHVNKIVITRPLVTVEEELGFLPGDILKKMDPWTRPIFDIFLEHISKTELNNLLFNNVIEISPLAFMRGRTFKNAFIIADEMQNSSPNQMKMLTSRIGENSKMVITGDLKQTDRQIDNNGLYDFIMKYKNYAKIHSDTNIQIVEFKTTDIERSAIVQKIINIYNYDHINIKNSDCAIIPRNNINIKYNYNLNNSL
jgi:phosphate starvation-inducible PhoH-like protein